MLPLLQIVLLMTVVHVSALYRDDRPMIFRDCWSSDWCCLKNNLRSALPDVYSINAKPNIANALAIFFGCYDPRVPLIAVMMDPNNNRMEIWVTMRLLSSTVMKCTAMPTSSSS